MFHQSLHAASSRSHLNCSQVRVEHCISDVQVAVDQWREDLGNRALWKECIAKIDQLKAGLDDHIVRIAGEGVLEDAVVRCPSLYTSVRAVESWQERLAIQLSSIIDRLRRWSGNDDEAKQISKDVQEFRHEFVNEEREERHLIDRGLGSN